ncbi:uncharacterized protein [Watersipora subatra]|uniref:uncharacterized protein n=1 Tax=Watersipora subatra TaxID=2589382 RepID=UPI00355BCFA8
MQVLSTILVVFCLNCVISNGARNDRCEEELRILLQTFDPNHSENCYTAEQALIHVIEECRVEDSVYAIAQLRTAINKLDYEGCLGDVPHQKDECHEIFACFRPVFTTAASSFICGPDRTYVDVTRRCLSNKKCHLGRKLVRLLDEATVELCKGSACINDAGVFRAVPRTSCKKYTWLVPFSGRVYTYRVPPGTMFGVDICHHRFIDSSPCWQ